MNPMPEPQKTSPSDVRKSNHLSSNFGHFTLPTHDEIDLILELENPLPRNNLLDQALLTPLEGFFSANGKRVRSQILELGFLWAGKTGSTENSEQLNHAARIIEGLHAGSMIIDDIQDSSDQRRGQASMHRRHGIPLALNAGNWLYFWAQDQIRLLGLEPTTELALQHYFNRILLRAHFGQAIDVGISVSLLDRSEVKKVCLASMELKTGALMSLAFDLGACVAGCSQFPSTGANQFARRFGVALQMFDDISNFSALPPKGKEDLKALPGNEWVEI